MPCDPTQLRSLLMTVFWCLAFDGRGLLIPAMPGLLNLHDSHLAHPLELRHLPTPQRHHGAEELQLRGLGGSRRRGLRLGRALAGSGLCAGVSFAGQQNGSGAVVAKLGLVRPSQQLVMA